ncbi:MAG: hypothetical protein K8R74_07025 [Bacteroidales bacterium]|nr:hypothetical protein [Bacteroidales bacterium]
MREGKYYKFGNQHIFITSKKDVYEKLYLQAIIISCQVIDKSSALENEIRDRIVWDLQKNNPLISQLFQNEIVDIIPERYNLLSPTEKSRADICFHWSDFGKFEIECKRLFQQPSKNEAYLNDGLVRFIDLKYAEKNEFAGMLGFVVSVNIEEIQEKLHNDTNNFHPNDLNSNRDNLNWKYSFVSNHKKKDNRKLQIYHLFFQFTDN